MVTRLRLVSLASPPALSCLHASRNARTWTGSVTRSHSLSGNRRTEQRDISEDDLDMDEVESKLEALVKEERKKEKSAKFHMTRRKLSSSGAPERRLNWDAIQQIRYLKQESPQEWTLQRLAEGFSVSTDVISRVLRSKFTPPPVRRLKQDAKVLTAVRQLSLKDGKTSQSHPALPTSIVPALTSSGNTSTVIALTSTALTPAEVASGLVPTAANVPSSSVRTVQISAVAQGTVQEQSAARQEPKDVKERGVEREEEEEWDGVVFTDEGLEELIHTLQEKPSAVEQKGREFYDSDGNFLYRI